MAAATKLATAKPAAAMRSTQDGGKPAARRASPDSLLIPARRTACRDEGPDGEDQGRGLRTTAIPRIRRPCRAVWGRRISDRLDASMRHQFPKAARSAAVWPAS